MPNLALVTDLELMLQQPVPTAKLAAADFALFSASAAVRDYCRQLLDLVEDDEVTLDPSGRKLIFLPQLPVVELVSVVEDGETLTADAYILADFGVLHRVGRFWPVTPQSVTVVYSHGYSDIPETIRVVTARAAARVYQSGLRADSDAGVPGIASKSLGDFSVAYASEQAITEGVAGATAARLLLLSEKDLLDRHRV